ncbi:hypothetical protein D3C81_1318570 [compost metagenome]
MPAGSRANVNCTRKLPITYRTNARFPNVCRTAVVKRNVVRDASGFSRLPQRDKARKTADNAANMPPIAPQPICE